MAKTTSIDASEIKALLDVPKVAYCPGQNGLKLPIEYAKTKPRYARRKTSVDNVLVNCKGILTNAVKGNIKQSNLEKFSGGDLLCYSAMNFGGQTKTSVSGQKFCEVRNNIKTRKKGFQNGRVSDTNAHWF